jgi:hypothetical protein
LALLDLSAAFDTVNHQVLLERLNKTLKVSGHALQWFKSYLDNRTVQVCVEGSYSEKETTDCAVPQGSFLGPRMYSDYTQPLGNLIRILLLLFHMYADDTQLLKLFKPASKQDQDESIVDLQSGIDIIATWMKNNKLKLNEEKTEFLVIASATNQNKIVNRTLTLSNEKVESSKSARNLGVVIDEHMSLNEQINSVRKSCYYYISWIKKNPPLSYRQCCKVPSPCASHKQT